jgi:hypothetical protein
MLLVVAGVSSLVHVYSTEYLAGDPHQGPTKDVLWDIYLCSRVSC